LLQRLLTYLFTAAIVLFTSNALSQFKLPPVNNFNVKDYKGGNQNWGIESKDGHLYVANNEGLLEFDGLHWYLYKLPNKTIIRSVKVVGDKIYTGSYEEFGFWQREKNGQLQYTSLSHDLEGSDIDSQSIWGIYEMENQIVFKSFGSIFIYKNDKIKIIQPGYTLMAAYVLDNRFIVHGINKGLVELKGEELVLLKSTEKIANYRVQSIISHKKDQLLIATSLQGCFLYADKQLKEWDTSFNNLLQERQLNTLSSFEDKLFFGTIKNGIYEYNTKNQTYLNINVKNGLQNNTVLSSTIDSSNILWVALDNGVSAIPTDYYAYYLNPFKENIGAVYDMVQLDNEVYVATNTGVYRVDTDGVYFMEGSQGHTWSLTLIDNQIICGNNSGTFKIENGKFSLISPKNGGYIFKRIPETTNQYIQGNYSGLTLYTKEGDNWQIKDIGNLIFPVKNIVFEKPHIAWVSHASKGVYKVHFSDDYESVLKIEEQYNKEFSNVYDIKLFNVEGDMAFFCDTNWFVYNPIEDRIEAFASMDKILGGNKNAVVLNNFSDAQIVFKRNDNSIFIRNDLQNSNTQKYVPKKYYNNQLVRGEGYQKAILVNDSLVYIALYNDVLVVNTNKIVKNKELEKPLVSRIFKNGIPQELNIPLDIKKSDTLQIELNSPFLSNNLLEYSIRKNQWLNTDGRITLTELPFGSMDLFIRSSLHNDSYSDINTIQIKVKSPWYLGVWGIIAVIALTIFIIILITTINKYVLIKHKNYLDEKFTHQQEIDKTELALQNEIKLNELKTKQHEIELNAKTKELANTALEMTKKDELLESIKKELQFFNSEIISKAKFNKLMTTINRNIHTSKDWEIFESNFNEIHDSFFNTLVKTHTNLSSKDLKLCAYLKMNLSSKEIAPIMGISIRGVEIHRYRLRKKLELKNEEKINEYLMNIS